MAQRKELSVCLLATKKYHALSAEQLSPDFLSLRHKELWTTCLIRKGFWERIPSMGGSPRVYFTQRNVQQKCNENMAGNSGSVWVTRCRSAMRVTGYPLLCQGRQNKSKGSLV